MILFTGIVLGNLMKKTKYKKGDDAVQESEKEHTFTEGKHHNLRNNC